MDLRRWVLSASLFVSAPVVLARIEPAQADTTTLEQVEGFPFIVRCSPGHAERARDMAARCERAMTYMDAQLKFRPELELKVLAEADWKSHAQPIVYGMPHPMEERILVLAAEDNPFWRSFVPDMASLPADLGARMRSAYGKPGGGMSMQPFFDLLVLHELAHLYHLQKPVALRRNWLGELFANVFLHTFIAEQEPSLLPALTLFPELVLARGTQAYMFTTLQQFQTDYNTIATKHPTNYAWYQCRLHQAAVRIHERGGAEVLRRFWDVFAARKESITDEELLVLLREEVHSSVAEVMTKW